MREIIGDLLIIALGIILLFHLIPLCIWGKVIIYEYNKGIVITEITMAVGILTFGIWGLCRR